MRKNLYKKSLNSSSVRIGEGESFRKSRSGSCSWTKATSFQQFQNDREQHEKNDSVSSAYSYGTSFDRGYDRTAKDGCGWDRQFSTSKNRYDSRGEGWSNSNMTRKSESGASTGDYPGFQIQNAIYDTPPIGAFFAGLYPEANINIGFPADPGPRCGGIDASGNATPCTPVFNGGLGQSVSMGANFSISILPTVAIQASISGNAMKEWKITSVCSWGKTCVGGNSQSKNSFSEIGHSENSATGESEDTSTEVRDIKRTGETHKQSESKVDSLSSATMRSQNEKKTGSDNSAHAQSDSSGSGQSWSKRHSENNSEANYESSYVSQARYWHGISQNLSKLFDSVNKEMDVLLKQISASYSPQYGVLTLPQSGIPCAPRYNLALKNQGDPCLRGCSYCGNQTCGGCGRI
jgi:hypothetical protein